MNDTWTFEAGDWYSSTAPLVQTLTVGAGEVTSIAFPIRVEKVGAHALTVVAEGSSLSDAVRRTARVLPGGQVVLESLIVEQPPALRPHAAATRYARMRNVWWVPTIPELVGWLRDAGFVEIRVVDVTPTSTQEQRQTEWMPFAVLGGMAGYAIGYFALDWVAPLIEEGGRWELKGDPSEGALITAAAKAGIEKTDLEAQSPRVDEIPFSSERKRMTTLNHRTSEVVAYSKGAPEIILASCSSQRMGDDVGTLEPDDRERLERMIASMAADALRVLANPEISWETLELPYSGSYVFRHSALWPDRFDYILVVDFGDHRNPLPELLQPRHTGSYFVIYENRRRPRD